ncbi:hypothetical protein [Enteractinococcus coprophilus]|uniref:SatD family protein n=1 Tax=Enteractinococcus coprophilus TaxID=1027633 RepID=A0A543AJE0_9MICC|nr:hypothetical protein [Enteractinococcus coprophilus]TQL72694.1 hypothetical protein FB556_1361 [Enteractinococcus coprophilus]
MLCLTLTLAKNIPDSQAPAFVGQLVESLNWGSDAVGGAGSRFEATGIRQVQGHLASADETVGFILSAARSGMWAVHLTIIPQDAGERSTEQVNEWCRDILCQAVNTGPQALRAPGGVRVVKAQADRLVDSTTALDLGPIESTLQLLCSIERRRSDEGQEAGLMINAGNSQTQTAKALGVSQQAVSARLQAGYWYESRKMAYWLAVQLNQLLIG